MTVTLTLNNQTYYKAIWTRFIKAIKVGHAAYQKEIKDNIIYPPAKEVDFP